jgi:serine/threonine protein kinase
MNKISIYNVQDTPIGRGGMGQVYLGTDPQGRRVAIKEMLAQYVSDPHLRRWLDGIHILDQLEHPFIVKTHALFAERGNLYLVMEYVEGETVEQYVKRRGRFSESEAGHLVLDVLSALDYAHSKGFLHRDIKPSNIMIRPDGSPCLLDFDITRVITANAAAITTTYITFGAVSYMSPEQATGLNIDHRSDIYSLGCLLYYMLVGDHAIQKQSSDYATRVAIIEKKFPRAKDFNPGLSDHIQRILDKATDRNMLRRFQSCREFAAELSLNVSEPSRKPDDKEIALPPRRQDGEKTGKITFRNKPGIGWGIFAFLVSLGLIGYFAVFYCLWEGDTNPIMDIAGIVGTVLLVLNIFALRILLSENKMTERMEIRKAKLIRSLEQLGYGILTLAIGGGVSIASFAMSSEFYRVAIGAIVIGAAYLLIGIVRFIISIIAFSILFLKR